MRVVENFVVSKTVLDFRSAGLEPREVTQVQLETDMFANAVELTSWDSAEQFQTILCPSCGCEGCAVGGWLTLRRAGEYAIWMPAFAALLDAGTDSAYTPPDAIDQHGALLMTRDTFERLRSTCGALPSIEQLPVISGAEVSRVLQWGAPLDALGVFPDPVLLRREIVVAAPDDADHRLETALARLAASSAPLVRPPTAGERSVSLFLDGYRTPEWEALVVDTADGWRLAAGPLVVDESG